MVRKLAELALILASGLLAGFFGLAMVFSDLGPGETWTARILLIVGLYSGFGLLVGLAFPARWKLALLSAWGPGLMGLVAIFSNLMVNPVAAPQGLLFLAPLGIVGLASYGGQRLRKSLSRPK